MKRTTFLKRTAAALLLTVMTATAWAETTIDGWSYYVDDGKCIITGKTISDGGPTGVTTLTIPKTIGDKPVVSISQNALSGFTDLTTIRFYFDASIQNMPYVQNNTKFTTVELINDNKETISNGENCLPTSMTEIGNAFKGSGITELTMPGVTSIGGSAFEGCNSLTSLTFKKEVTIDTGGYQSTVFSKIGSTCTVSYPGSMAKWSYYDYQFSPNLVVKCSDGSCGWCGDGWSNGTSYQNSSCLYWKLETAGNLAIECVQQDDMDFYKQKIKTQNWDKAKVKTLTVGRVYFVYNVFCDYPNLTTVNISANMTSIDVFPFISCPSLTRIVVDEGNPTFDSRDGCNAIIETATNTLVVGCKNTSFPSSVTTIGVAAFEGCSGLTSIIIPNSVTTIGGNAFQDCTSLISITIPNSVTTIEESSFQGCTGLVSVTIPNNVTTIGDNAFLDCSSLTTITIPNNVTTIGQSAFQGCNVLTSITIPSNVTTIGAAAFRDCTSLVSVTIPNNVTTIEDWAFYGCSNLTDIYFDGTSEQWDQVEKGVCWNLGVPSTCQVYYPAAVTTTAANKVVIPFGQEWTDIPVTVSSLYLGWFQNEGQPAHRADAVAVVPSNGTAFSLINPSDNTLRIDASQGAGTHAVGNLVSEPLTAVGESGTLWIYIPKATWDAAAAGEYSQFLYYDAAFLYNGTQAETGIYSLGSDATVTVSLTVPETVTLTFDANGGSGDPMAAVTGRAGIAMTLPACAYSAPAGKQFLCWNTKSNGTGTRYMAGENIPFTASTTLYAEWGGEALIDLTSATEQTIPLGLSGQMTVLTGYFMNDGQAMGLDVNLDGTIDVELKQEYDDVNKVMVCSAKKLTNLTSNYRFALTLTGEEGESESVLIKFADGGATVEQPALELLYDNDDSLTNTFYREQILKLKDGQTHNLMLDGRTLYKDGDWNTLCLPFNIVSFTGTVLDGATVMELDTDGTYGGHKTGLVGTTLYLNFKDAISIEAGKPYIVKWAGGTDIVNPVFNGVTVTAATTEIPNPYRYSIDDPETITVAAPTDITFTGGKFCGTYDPIHFYAEDQSTLFLGAASTLYYPQPSGGQNPSIGAFRAYFDLSDAGSSAIAFRLNFGSGDATGVASPQPSPEGKGDWSSLLEEGTREADWFDLSGRRLNGAPTAPGIYIKDGKKIIVK